MNPRHAILSVVLVVALAAALLAGIYFWRRGTRGYPFYVLFWVTVIALLFLVWRLLS